jgi:anthranilate synthase component 1
MYHPPLEQFLEQSRTGNLVPVYREILADLETPVSAFLKIGGNLHSFLLESVAGGEQISRYSFIGGEAFQVLKTKGRNVTLTRDGKTESWELEPGQDPLHVLRDLMAQHQIVANPDLPPFCGGAVGYIGYDTVRFFEVLPDHSPDDRELPDCYFVFTDTLLIFDHVRHQIKVLCLVRVGSDPAADYQVAADKINRLVERLGEPLPIHARPARMSARKSPDATAIPPRPEYTQKVLRAKEYISAGDVIQVVLSRRLRFDVEASPFEIYRALRCVNPSPYMFFLQFAECQIIGASPEILVSERSGSVVTRPIAGTVRRGRTAAEDAQLEAQLLADPKERAEHIMLVDLHRNDIGRVCEYGSVQVDQLMVTEKYSHVIHIVSNVVGRLRPECDRYDLIRAAFPAGTLSGAPKIRAMEIIEELEPVKRGPYGGAIGYFSFNGNTDTAITLRTIVMVDQAAYVQAGGGIVADSDPDAEFAETESKAGALRRAIELAERGLE